MVTGERAQREQWRKLIQHSCGQGCYETGRENRRQGPKSEQRTNLNTKPWGLPGGLVVKPLFPVQGLWVRSPVGELRFHMPCSQKTKTKNGSNIVTNSIKTLKMVRIKKKINTRPV